MHNGGTHMAEVGDKYIIEIGDKYLSDNQKDTLYKAKNFNSLVFDQNGINKLTNLDVIKNDYVKQVDKFVENANKSLDTKIQEAYKAGYAKGYEDCAKENNKADKNEHEFEDGLNAAWDIARKLSNLWMSEENENLIKELDIKVDWGNSVMYAATHQLTAQEALEKIMAIFNEKEEKKEVINIGDELVADGINPFIVTRIDCSNDGNPYYFGIETNSGTPVHGGMNYTKTGRSFPEVAQMFAKEKKNDESRNA